MVDGDLESLYRDGYVVLERVIDRHVIAELALALAPHEHPRPRRVYSLAGKGQAFLGLAEHPAVLALVDRVLMPNFLLSTMHSIRLHANEREETWHTDDAFYFSPRPHALPLAVGVLWALED